LPDFVHDDFQRKFEPASLKIIWNSKGLLKTTGPMDIKTNRDNIIVFRGESILLCGCGKSKNNPFCDGSHGKGLFSKGKK